MGMIAMRGLRLLAGGGTLGALAVFAVVLTALSWLGPLSVAMAVALTGAGRAIARVWGYALS